MIEVEARYLKVVREILKKYVANREVRAFGSRVAGKHKQYSDLDLVVVGEAGLPKKALYSLQEEFAESDLPFRVDVLDWHRVSENFREIIMRKYETIQKGSK